MHGRRLALSLAAAATLLAGVAPGLGHAAPDGKTTICHKTGSAKNPYVIITPSNNSLPAHAAHGDIIPATPGCVVPTDTSVTLAPISEL